MKIKLLALIILGFQSSYGQELKKEYQSIINSFIDCVRNNNKEKIAEMTHFPFEREYPIPTIKSNQEFIKRYSEIFDDTLKQLIVASNPSKDWEDMGWRGIMLYDGKVWIDFNGRLIGINYQSKLERKQRDQIIESEKKMIHSSLSKFKEPICILETTKFRIRIDDLGQNYRYASWSIKKSMRDEPDLIIEKGELISDGTGGNHSYKFKRGGYTYDCSIIVMGEDGSPPAKLIVYKGDKEILSENAILVGN